MEKIKNGKIRKIFIYFCILNAVIYAAFGLAFSSRKVKAGVVVDESTTWQIASGTSYTNYSDIDITFRIAIDSVNLNVSNGFIIASFSYFDGATSRYLSVYSNSISYINPTQLMIQYQIYLIGYRNTFIDSCDYEYATYGNNTYIALAFKSFIDKVISRLESVSGYITYPVNINTSANWSWLPLKKISSATIAQVNNIYDLQQDDLALIYISDISGIALTLHDEITINWGYIDAADNTIYRVHAPAVQAQLLNAQAQTIRLAVPTNAAGDVLSYYDIDQRSILTTITTGGATATAHIYGVYVWVQNNRIQWGLAEFDTSGLPASGASMNYITSITSIYDYTAINTSTMTCRLSISNNFNFITIKNQNSVDVASVNAVIRQGGFLPAWAVYNWARGSASGYVSGEQAGAAPYQPGNAGYQSIYDEGYRAGVNANVGTVNWFVSAFSAVDAFLSIHIFPNITFGALLGIPFIISVVWFIIRTFRGGGGGN